MQRLSSIRIIGLLYAVGAIALLAASGCSSTTPNIRQGSLPTTTWGIPLVHPKPPFLHPDKLGSHSYSPNPFEKSGIVYTCDAGHVDISHVRANADDARFFVKKIYDAMRKGKSGFKFTFAFEQSRHRVKFTYPENWKNLPKKERNRIARELSYEAGEYLTYNATMWHEFLTWFGVRFALIEPEFNSAFSWEDIYSNLLGVKLGIRALKDPDHGYNKAMTIAINEELKILRVQPRKTAIEVTERMRGKWFKGAIAPAMLRRNTDIGVDDGFVSPVITPGVCEDVQPRLLTVPTLDVLKEHGFTMTYEIVPVYLETRKMLRISYPNGGGKVIEPMKHYPLIIEHIEKEAVEKYNHDISR